MPGEEMGGAFNLDEDADSCSCRGHEQLVAAKLSRLRLASESVAQALSSLQNIQQNQVFDVLLPATKPWSELAVKKGLVKRRSSRCV